MFVENEKEIEKIGKETAQIYKLKKKKNNYPNIYKGAYRSHCCYYYPKLWVV